MTSSSSGSDVDVVLHGVRDRRHLDVLTDAVARIPGVGGVRTLGYERPDAPVVSVRITGTVALTAALRSRLGATAVRVDEVDGRVLVRLADVSTASGRPRTARDVPRRRTTPGTAARPRADEPRRRPFEPWTLGTQDAPWAGPAPVAGTTATATTGGPGCRAVTPTDPTGMLDAFGAEADLSILIYDARLAVRAAYGGLHTGSQRLRDGLVGRHIDDVLPPRTYVGLAELAASALRGRSGELTVVSDASDRHYRITVKPVHDGPDVVGCMTVTRDVTQQQQGAALLGELSDVFEATFDRSPAGQALLTPDGDWLRANDALARILGRPSSDLVGTNLLVVTAASDRDRERDLIAEVRAGSADGYELDKRFVRPDGQLVHAYVRMTPVRAVDGAVRGFVAHVVDADRWRPAAADRGPS